jgi:cytoskeletal protein CcmA (bactofilin family)
MEQPEQDDDINALETLETPEGGDAKTAAPSSGAPKIEPKNPKKSRTHGFLKRITEHFNIYFLIFLLLVVVTVAATIISYNRQKNETAPEDIASQQLDENAFGQLQSGDTSVGDPKQTLTVQSNTIFSGQVLARSNIEIAGELKVGGALNLSGLVVSGDSTLNQIQANELSLSGDANIQGQLDVSRGLTVAGGASFGGPISSPLISVDALQLNGDLQFTRHIDAGGPTPSKASGGALGSGGTVSVSGTDTAGTIKVNTGGGATSGCFVTITFARSFGETPHVVVTPIGANAAGINYYVNRGTTDFQVCTTNNPPSNSNFAFDYIVIE